MYKKSDTCLKGKENTKRCLGSIETLDLQKSFSGGSVWPTAFTQLMEDAGFPEDLGVQSKAVLVAWVRLGSCVRNPWAQLCLSIVVGVHLCPALQAFLGRCQVQHLATADEGLQSVERSPSTCAVHPEPLGSWAWLRVCSGGGQEEPELWVLAG